MRWLPLAILAILVCLILSIAFLHTPGSRTQGPGGSQPQAQRNPLSPENPLTPPPAATGDPASPPSANPPPANPAPNP